jgi:CIC family chloride channel protein
MSEDRGHATAGDIATKTLIITYPDVPVQDILKKPGAFDLGRIPVVSRDNRRHLVGVLRREDIVRAYLREAGEEETQEE